MGRYPTTQVTVCTVRIRQYLTLTPVPISLYRSLILSHWIHLAFISYPSGVMDGKEEGTGVRFMNAPRRMTMRVGLTTSVTGI